MASGGRQPPVAEENRGLTPPARRETHPARQFYIEAPDEYDGAGPSLFLAGGITGTHDWQTEVVGLLADLPLTILNPRRKNFPIDDPNAVEGQITWEFHHIRRATAVLFWFPHETLCPIALYELGSRAMAPEQSLFVGTHRDYQRRLDVEIQLRLVRPEVRVAADIPEMIERVRYWFRSRTEAWTWCCRTVWHGACITRWWHGNPARVSGTQAEAWADEPSG